MSHLQAILIKNHQLSLKSATFSDAPRSQSCPITQNSLQNQSRNYPLMSMPVYLAFKGDMSHYNCEEMNYLKIWPGYIEVQ